MNLLLKLSLSQSVLIIIFTSWIYDRVYIYICVYIYTYIYIYRSVCKVASLVNTFLQAFLEVLHHSLQHVGRNCCHIFPDGLFQVYRRPWFLFVHLAFEITSEEEVLRLGTLSFRWLLKCRRNIRWVTTTESLFFGNRLHSESPMLYRPALHGNWNALSLARRALMDKFPPPTVPLTAVLPNRQVFLPDPVLTLNLLAPTTVDARIKP